MNQEARERYNRLRRDPWGFLIDTVLLGLAAQAGALNGRHCPVCGKTEGVTLEPCEACK